MSTPVENQVANETSEAAFGMNDFVRVIAKRAGLIRTVTLLVVAATAAVMFSLPTLYSTSAVVMLDQRKNTVADASTVLSALPTDPSSVQNQIHVLSSRDLALKVIDKLHLEADPEFNPALGGGGVDLNPLHLLRREGQAAAGDPRDLVVSAFLSHLDVSSLGVSTSIEVSVTSKDPEKAARIANTLAESYTDDMIANASADAIGQANPDSPSAAGVKKRYGKATNIRSFAGSSGQPTEMDALIAYLQMLGTLVDFKLYNEKANLR